jgi:hypothetical protein
MENKLDKLFRDKLEQHAMPPSAHAWEKVAAGYPKKNNGLVWAWRMAAAVMLMGAIGWYAFDASTGTAVQVAKESPLDKKQDEVKIDNNKVEKNATVTKETATPPKQKTIQEFKKPVESTHLAKVEKKEMIQEDTQPVVAITSVEEVKETAVLVEPALQPKQEKTMVIVYSLASVETKTQSVEPVKSKGIKKVIEFAKDVKGGETTLASVRDWKDNFFGSDEQTRVEKQNNNN